MLRGFVIVLAVLGVVLSAGAFSLLGPSKGAASGFVGDPWQEDGYGDRPQGLGYSIADNDIGGPMLPFEAYRWNVPVITYAYDLTFLRYFGTNGVAAVEEAMAILNALPPASRMSTDLSEFPLDSKSENSEAAALGILDLKSIALASILEEMGLASSERFVWGLRGRITGVGFTNYSVIQLNYDPVTIQPSRHVNGVLYNYQIIDDLGPLGDEWASAVEWYQLDPLYRAYSSVAGSMNGEGLQSSPVDPSRVASAFGLHLRPGQYFTGLTRDDAGAIRYLLSTNHMVVDTLLPTVLPRLAGAQGSPWAPVIGIGLTNAQGLSNIVVSTGTNFTNFVRTAMRPGVDKITFQRVSLLGTNFTPITLRYTDKFINPNNGRIVRQAVERLVIRPDIIFSVRDLGVPDNGVAPFLKSRTGTDGWVNNAALNSFYGPDGLGGPGTIAPGIEITLSDLYPYWVNSGNGSVEIEGLRGLIWGSFDGTTRPPVLYPMYQDQLSLQYIRDVVLGGTGN